MDDSPVVLLTGWTGQVGHELRTALAPLGRVVAPSRSELDLARPESMRAVIRAVRPAVVVNAAAYTAVDRAESEPEICAAINAEAPRVLAEEAARSGALMVHYSTDYVFDGRKDAPYVEVDETAPLNVYGRTKLAGERAVAGAGGRHIILRTSWVYGPHGVNFLRTMLRLARERRELRVVDDQTGAPTWSRSIARATAAIVSHVLGDASADDASGVYHLTSTGATTWYDFATAILAGDPARGEQICERVLAISSAEYPTPARRPASSLLDSGKVRQRFGISIPHWREDLARVLAEPTLSVLA